MGILQVNTNTRNYPIYIEQDFHLLNEALRCGGFLKRKFLILTDSNVEKLYLNEVLEIIKTVASEVYTFSIEAGEKNKNLQTVEQIYGEMVKRKLDRKSVIVALGGGVVGDIAGFAAATFMRGIEFIQIPTTLLAQVDSSVGGKTGVDFNGSKNMVGAFYQPTFVYTNAATLLTLSEKEFASGLGEVIKHGLIMNRYYYDFISDFREEIEAKDLKILTEVIKGSCTIKATVVNQDEKEKGLRKILNFGHTFGHAIESLSNFELSHGECVAIGSIAAMVLSYKIGFIQEQDIENVSELYDYFHMTTKVKGILPEAIINQMQYDKKNENNTISYILLEKIGTASVTDGEEIPEKMIHEAISYMIK